MLMMTSLAELAENLGNNDFQQLRKEFPNPIDFELVKKKGIFPYDFFTSLEKMNQSELPSRNDF